MLISKDSRKRKTLFFLHYPLGLSFAICLFNYLLRHKINELESPSKEITENSWARGLRPTTKAKSLGTILIYVIT